MTIATDRKPPSRPVPCPRLWALHPLATSTQPGILGDEGDSGLRLESGDVVYLLTWLGDGRVPCSREDVFTVGIIAVGRHVGQRAPGNRDSHFPGCFLGRGSAIAVRTIRFAR